MNHYLVDKFMSLKYPEKYQELTSELSMALQSRGIIDAKDAEEMDAKRKSIKLAALEGLNNEAGEALGISHEDLLNMQEARSARKRLSGNKRHSEAMDIAAASFLASEIAGVSAIEAVNNAEDAIGDAFSPSTAEHNLDRKTLSAWLRDLQGVGVISIAVASKGRPKKE